MSESRGEWRLPEAVFDITPQPLALVKNGLDAAIQSGVMKRNSYRMCPDTGAVIVGASAVNEIAANFFGKTREERKVAVEVADEIVAQSLRQYRQPVLDAELPAHEMPVMLSA